MVPMVFQFIGETVQNATNAFVTPAATNLMYALQMIAITGVTLYIVLTGYAISTGAIESPFWTFVKQCVKIVIIAAFALTGYSSVLMWRNSATRATQAVSTNWALLYHRVVTPLDLYIARITLEVVAATGSLLGLSCLFMALDLMSAGGLDEAGETGIHEFRVTPALLLALDQLFPAGEGA